VHTGSPLMVDWHVAQRDALQLPPLYDVDDVIATFGRAGFHTSMARLAIRFVPIAGRDHNHEGRSLGWLSYYQEDKVMLRFARPCSPP
jgi:hypothetical protein